MRLAAIGGRTSEVLTFLDEGADVNQRLTKDGHTALILAAEKGRVDTIVALVKRGANLESKTFNEWTPLMLAAMNGFPSTTRTLVELGANINAQGRSTGQTPLLLACKVARPETTEVLVKMGANLELRAKDGLTALMILAKKGDDRLCELLIRSGADVAARETSHAARGRTALDYLAAIPHVHDMAMHAEPLQRWARRRRLCLWRTVAGSVNLDPPAGQRPPTRKSKGSKCSVA